jgi:microcystin-dependent protein
MLTVNQSHLVGTSITSLITVGGMGSTIDVKDIMSLMLNSQGYLAIVLGQIITTTSQKVAHVSLSNLESLNNQGVMFAYESSGNLSNSGVIKAWALGGSLTWTPIGEGAIGDSTFDEFGWKPPIAPPPSGSGGTGGTGGTGGDGGDGGTGGTGVAALDDINNRITALTTQLNSVSSSVTAQLANLNTTVEASRTEYVSGLGTIRNDLVTGLDGLEHNLTNGIDVVKQDLVNGLAEAGQTINQVDSDLKSRIADARVEYVNPKQVGLASQTVGLAGGIWVQGELMIADSSIDVYNTCPVLDWNYRTSEIVVSYIQPDTEYFIYLANHESPEYNVMGLSATSGFPATSEWDFRGKLFLSTTLDVGGYFSDYGAGLNARIVGSLRTDSSPYETFHDGNPTSDCGPFFLQEVDISWIAKKTSYPETYREYCDFKLSYEDKDTIDLTLIDGLYGQIAVGGDLHVYSNSQKVRRGDVRIKWNDFNPYLESYDLIELDETPISTQTTYYIYVSNDRDIWNFNYVNPNTGSPWTESDLYASLFYDRDVDLRKSVFISEKEPEYGLMSQQWPGYCARYIGKVSTDVTGYFIYKPDISEIRSLQLSPTDFAGLAEITLSTASDFTNFKVIKKTGTSGTIFVGGLAIETYDLATCPPRHIVYPSSYIYTYSDGSVPIASESIISNRVGSNIYIYMTSSADHWDSLASSLIASTSVPTTDGYLSKNWPGNTARWIVTINLVSSNFSGSYVRTTVLGSAAIDDYTSSVITTYSSIKIKELEADLVKNTPVGTIIDYAGTVLPDKWLLCNGAEVSRITYASLFTAIGTIWGIGNGSTTFNLPNLIDRTTIGYGTRSVGTTLGTETHVLSVSEMPIHDHGSHSHPHAHGGGTGAASSCYRYVEKRGESSKTVAQAGSTSHTHSISQDNTYASVPNAGGGISHNNMQPSAVVLKIIRY